MKERIVSVAVACPGKPGFIKSAVALLFVFLVSILGHSQTYRSFRDERDAVIRTAKYRIGPFWISPSIGLKDLGLDSNVYLEREDQGPVSDYTFTVFSTAKISYLLRRSIMISVRENPEYVHYFKERRERGWNNVFLPELRVLLLNRFVLNASYLDSKTRYRATAEFNARVNVYRKGPRGSLFFETPRGTALGISWSSEEITYGDIPDLSISRFLNRKEQDANLEFYYRIVPESTIFFKGGFKEYRFFDPQYRWRDAYSYQAYSGLQFPILGRIRGTLSLGYKRMIPRDAKKQKFSGLVGDTTLSLRIHRFALRFGFVRDCHMSYWSDNVFFVGSQAGTGVSFYPTRFLRVDYDFSYGRYNYPEEATILSPIGQPEQMKRADLFRSHTAGLVFRVMRNAGVGLAVNYWTRESNLDWENRKRFFWGAYLTYEF